MNLKKISILVMISVFTLSCFIISCESPADGTSGINGISGTAGEPGAEGDTILGPAFLTGPIVRAADLAAAFEITKGEKYRAGTTYGGNVYLASSVTDVEGEVPAGRTLEVIGNPVVLSGGTLNVYGDLKIREGAVFNAYTGAGGTLAFQPGGFSNGTGIIIYDIGQFTSPSGVSFAGSAKKVLGGTTPITSTNIADYWDNSPGTGDDLVITNAGTALAATEIRAGKTVTLIGTNTVSSINTTSGGKLIIGKDAIVTVPSGIAITGGSATDPGVVVKGTLKLATGTALALAGNFDVSDATLDFSAATGATTLTIPGPATTGAPVPLKLSAIIGNNQDVSIANATSLQVDSISGFVAANGVYGAALTSFAAAVPANKLTLGAVNPAFKVSELEGNTFVLANAATITLTDTLAIVGNAKLKGDLATAATAGNNNYFALNTANLAKLVTGSSVTYNEVADFGATTLTIPAGVTIDVDTTGAVFAALTDLTVNGTFNAASGTFAKLTKLTVDGAFTATAGTFEKLTELTVKQPFTAPAGTFEKLTKLTVDGTFTAAISTFEKLTKLTVAGTFTAPEGTFTASGLTASGNGTLEATFTEGHQSTVISKLLGIQDLSIDHIKAGGAGTNLTIAAGKSLTIKSTNVTPADYSSPDGNITINGTLNLESPLIIQPGKSLTNAALVNINDGGALALGAGTGTKGAILKGTGKLLAGSTTITGQWQGVGAAGGAIAISYTDTYNVTGIQAHEDDATLTAIEAGAAITQAGDASDYLYVVEGDSNEVTAINFADKGSLVLKTASPAATVTLDPTSILYFGTGAATGTLSNAALKTALGDGTNGIAVDTGLTGNSSASGSGTLTRITGAAANNTITGPTSDDDLKISSVTVATGI
ncbi:putative lipoprotein [Treponema primitia ZAS-2]|uniref:Putative lipoprotein n=1 Tax=Treponema primitia (strain ATCC BAA-887 / DSM 12427 / ZAS-2) TaxID=545694 RepID=F5YP76_TREPZ|nr:hypothetical protein [Treponema primitia]AEF84951.1 putative lipoprotein [Treponema primitia ZAS-2]